MARAIKQSVDGSGYPSSALFPITGEREAEEGRGPSGRRYLCDGRGYGRAGGEERTIYIFGSVVASSLHECIAARKRKGGGPARWNYNPQGAPLMRDVYGGCANSQNFTALVVTKASCNSRVKT